MVHRLSGRLCGCDFAWMRAAHCCWCCNGGRAAVVWVLDTISIGNALRGPRMLLGVTKRGAADDGAVCVLWAFVGQQQMPISCNRHRCCLARRRRQHWC